MTTDRRVARPELLPADESRDDRSAADDEATAAAVPASGAALATPAPLIARGPVLLAVDGSPASEAAARVALALAEQRGARVHVLTVVDTRPAPIPPPVDLALALADGAYGEELHAEQKREVRAALSAALDRSIDWPVEVALGAPSHAIVREARRIAASLIVLGLRPHGAVDRATRDETTLHVMRMAPCPVLGTTPALTGLPQRVLVGVDFSRASLKAARTAGELVADDGTLVLAYLAPPPTAYSPDDGERVIHELGVAAAFAWFGGELGARPGVAVEPVALHRDAGRTVSEALLGYAADARIDLIALGNLRHGRIERWMLGSVTTDVARDGSHALLAVPPGDPAGR